MNDASKWGRREHTKCVACKGRGMVEQKPSKAAARPARGRVKPKPASRALSEQTFKRGDDVRVRLDIDWDTIEDEETQGDAEKHVLQAIQLAKQYSGYHGTIKTGNYPKGLYYHKRSGELWAIVLLTGDRTTDTGQLESMRNRRQKRRQELKFATKYLEKPDPTTGQYSDLVPERSVAEVKPSSLRGAARPKKAMSYAEKQRATASSRNPKSRPLGRKVAPAASERRKKPASVREKMAALESVKPRTTLAETSMDGVIEVGEHVRLKKSCNDRKLKTDFQKFTKKYKDQVGEVTKIDTHIALGIRAFVKFPSERKEVRIHLDLLDEVGGINAKGEYYEYADDAFLDNSFDEDGVSEERPRFEDGDAVVVNERFEAEDINEDLEVGWIGEIVEMFDGGGALVMFEDLGEGDEFELTPEEVGYLDIHESLVLGVPSGQPLLKLDSDEMMNFMTEADDMLQDTKVRSNTMENLFHRLNPQDEEAHDEEDWEPYKIIGKNGIEIILDDDDDDDTNNLKEWLDQGTKVMVDELCGPRKDPEEILHISWVEETRRGKKGRQTHSGNARLMKGTSKLMRGRVYMFAESDRRKRNPLIEREEDDSADEF